MKELNFTSKDTAQCTDGCYLLLKVVNKNFFYDDSRCIMNDISILTDIDGGIYSSEALNLPIEKYVLGNSISPINYILNIPEDAETVSFDIQGEDLMIYIALYNKDNEKFDDYRFPSEINPQWKFSTITKKNLFAISKNEIIDVSEKNGNKIDSLKGIILAITIEHLFKSPNFFSIYALKCHLEYKAALDIYEVYSEQQTLCNTSFVSYSGIYRCLYMVKYNDYDSKFNLVAYPILENKSTNYKIYANFILKENYTLNDFNFLESEKNKETIKLKLK